MKKTFILFLILMLLLAPAAFASSVSAETAEAWYELSSDNSVLTVRLPGNTKIGLEWEFEISNPDALELITHEVIEGQSEGMAGTPTTYVASFMSTASAENHVSLILRHAFIDDPSRAAAATRVLQLNVAADNTITVESVLDRSLNADWVSFEDGGYILLINLAEQENEDYAWDISISDTDILDLITCETTTGFVGSFLAPMTKAGFVDLTLSYGKRDSQTPSAMYTANLFVNESGEIWLESTEIFTIFESGSSSMSAAWLENDADNYILTVTLPPQGDDSKAWDIAISDEEIFELITCDTETGFIGSFKATMNKAGFVDLTLTYGDKDAPEAVYTVNLFVNESGELFVESISESAK